MLRLLHTADVRLGARHEDLGEAGAAMRERQHAAFSAAVDLALAEGVDLVLVAGDLFDANTASRRTVEHAAAELARLAAAGIRTVAVPGDHDPYTRASVYRSHDLPGLVGDGMLTVLTPAAPWVHLEALGVLVVGPADPARPSSGPFASPADAAVPPAPWRVGLLHAVPGDGPGDVRETSLEASGLDYAALGGEPTASSGRAGATAWAVPGSPEPVALGHDGPGTVTLVALDDRPPDGKSVRLERRAVGTARHGVLEADVAELASQEDLVARLLAAADPELVLDVRLAGERPDDLVLDLAAAEDAVRGRFLRTRLDDRSRPPLTAGALPPPETILGAFIRNIEGRIADLEASGAAEAHDEAAELREVLRMGRRLLAGEGVAL